MLGKDIFSSYRAPALEHPEPLANHRVMHYQFRDSAMGLSTRKSHSLGHQLLLSHLSVALIGLGMLCIALASTYGLRSRLLLLANESGPTAQASLQVLAGVWHSIARLGDWISLEDERFLQDWESAWNDEIKPAMSLLNAHREILQRSGAQNALDTLPGLLEKLKQSQWEVQDVARTPNNEPARITYQNEVSAIADSLHSIINSLILEEKNQAGGQERKNLVIRFAQLQQTISDSQILIRGFIDNADLDDEQQLQKRLQESRNLAAILAEETRLLTSEQRYLMERLQRILETFQATALRNLQQRHSPQWNLARFLMANETVPLAIQVTDLAETLATHSAALMNREARLANLTSTITLWVLVALIFAMLIMAYAVSRARARTLAQPIIALSRATQQLAAGRLPGDIPVTRDDELGDLTRAFNSMGASLQGTQQELLKANVFLEHRVKKRTLELRKANIELHKEIAEHERTEKTLRENEARLRAIANAVPDLLFVLDEDGRYLEVLSRRHHLFKSDPAILQGKLLIEAHPPDKAAFFLSIIKKALKTGQIQLAEYALPVLGGYRWFESRTAPVEVPAGNKPAVVVVARDITQRKAAEEQLRQAQKMEAIGQLTGGVAHDFNNLLAIVLGNLELLDEQLQQHPALQDLVHRAFEAADRGATLTQRLLAFSRRQPLKGQPVDLNELVTGMVDMLRRTLGETIQIETVLDPDLSQTVIDPGQFETALLNLALNARDAMPQGGKLLLKTLDVWLDENYAKSRSYPIRTGRYVMLAVSDTGVGMTPEVLEHVFEPFFTTKEVGKGSGLGLSMVYGLIKQSQGYIDIYSEIRQGTTVKLYLPVTNSDPVIEEKTNLSEPVHRGQAETILVVEDEPAVRQLAVSMLNNLGYRTLEASDGQSALQILLSGAQIKLLFTDMVLPGGISGVDLANEALRHYPNLKVLFTSGYMEDAMLNKDQWEEDRQFLAKPYRKNSLAHKVKTILGDN